MFGWSRFTGPAKFGGAIFEGPARFSGAVFEDDARFDGATFEATTQLGPMLCSKRFGLSGANFAQPVKIEAAARSVECERTRWASRASLAVRYAELDLTDAIFENKVTVTTRESPWNTYLGPLAEGHFSGPVTAKVVSISGIDAANLVLSGIDLSACSFTGSVNLDQIRLEGDVTLRRTPRGWIKVHGLPLRFTDRTILHEEASWRVRNYGDGSWGSVGAPDTPTPAVLTSLYRQLRKSFEDGKNEADAADFYYGEMEMRRNDKTRARSERGLLVAYWMLSGYGLRATRCLAWLMLSMAAVTLLLAFWGLPLKDPSLVSEVKHPSAEAVVITDREDLEPPSGPLRDRLTATRLDKSVEVVLNSAIFRTSGQNLTTIGRYTEMTARIVNPALLGLAILAVRNRIKR
nr:pentapeptide repeat-containing protein [Streptomyces viridosporus]